MLNLSSVHGRVGPINHDCSKCALVVPSARLKCDSAHWLSQVRGPVTLILRRWIDGSLCCILGKGVPFVPAVMQHGATEDVLLCALGALSATRMCAVRNKGAHCVRQRCALCANITFVFTTYRGRLPCGKMVRIFKFVFVPGLQYLLRTICFYICLRELYENSGSIYPGSPPRLRVLLV